MKLPVGYKLKNEMSPELDFVLLIDDDESTIFFHRIMVEESGVTNRILTANSGENGLQIILQEILPNPSISGIIFLDINMPLMNGWQVLDALERMPEKLPAHVILVMVSATVYPPDQERIRNHPLVYGQIPKPLAADDAVQLALKIKEIHRS
jgi:CheY-like chemotaxis protein